MNEKGKIEREQRATREIKFWILNLGKECKILRETKLTRVVMKFIIYIVILIIMDPQKLLNVIYNLQVLVQRRKKNLMANVFEF